MRLARRPFQAVFPLCALLVLPLIGACTRGARPEPADTLHLPASARIRTLDPAAAADLTASNEVGRVYEGLLQYHPLKRPYVLMPALAESMPDVSADGLVYTFHLKRGVLFQDDPCFRETRGKGREVVADDFVYSFKRLADPRTASPGWWILEGRIAGLNEWRVQARESGTVDYARPVEGLKALDRFTLQIRLTGKSEVFLYRLAMPYSSVVAREAVEYHGSSFATHPVGTGPFRLEELRSGGLRATYVRNPTFRKELYPSEGEPGDRETGLLTDAGQPLPLASRIVVEVYNEQQAQWAAFLEGRADLTPVPKDQLNGAVTQGKNLSPELKARGVELFRSANLDVTHESFNMSDPLIGKNRALRQALSLAFDVESWIDLFMPWQAVAARSPLPPGLGVDAAALNNPFRAFNLLRAKELLARAGYPGGKGLAPLTYLSPSDSTQLQMAEFLKKGFEAIGVTLEVKSLGWAEFQDAVQAGKGQLWAFAWQADYPQAENFLQLFYSRNLPPGPNDSRYRNPEFDRLYEKALLLSESAERANLYQRMIRILVDDCPWILGVHRLSFTMVQPWLKNFKPNLFDRGQAKYLRVSVAARDAQLRKSR